MKTKNLDPRVGAAALLFGFDPEETERIPGHEGGRNETFSVGDRYVLRLSNLQDRTLEDYLAETEYVRFLVSNGAHVADVRTSVNGKTVEVLGTGKEACAASLFTRARGDQLAEHGYRYIEGAPIEELWYNTGKTLGRIHELSKHYRPETKRFDFFEKYGEPYFEELIPDSLVCGFLGEEPIGARVKEKLHALLDRLRALPADAAHYGMIHFDFSDGNYNIDYQDGTVTAYDFDNCRTGWYLFDLANLWAHGVGWIAWNESAEERRQFMDRYFEAVCAGYRSETELSEETLADLPLMVDAVRLENLIDEFEVTRAETGAPECDGEQSYRLKGLLEEIPFMGFFHETYDPDSPFDLDTEE